MLGLMILINGSLVMAQAPTDTEVPTTPIRARLQLDPVCMQNALDKRDNAIIAGLDAYHAFVKSGLENRRNELKTAWNITDVKQRREAIKTAWSAFQGAWRNAAKELKNVKKSAWQQFYKERKACGGVSDDKTSMSADANL